MLNKLLEKSNYIEKTIGKLYTKKCKICKTFITEYNNYSDCSSLYCIEANILLREDKEFINFIYYLTDVFNRNFNKKLTYRESFDIIIEIFFGNNYVE